MKYNPDKHDRHSIRLKGYDYSSPGAYFITICTHQRACLFGNIADGEMQVNSFGQVIQGHWSKLPSHHPHLRLDEFIVMPNHIHGILILFNENECDQSNIVGAGLADTVSVSSDYLTPKPAPTHDQSQPKFVTIQRAGIPNIIRGFKTFSARQINRQRRTKGTPVWQRNYYEHIIRNEESFEHIRRYIQTNPVNWKNDQLHPENWAETQSMIQKHNGSINHHVLP